MSTTILLPLDGSPLAARAVPFAVRLARGAYASLRLVRAVADSEHGSPDESHARASLDAAAERLRADGAAAATVRRGDPERVIAEEARTHGADLIVMSTHGWGGLQRWLYGSVADRVLRRADVPVLLVPAACRSEWPDGPTGPVLVPLDGSPFAEEALEPAGCVARLLGAPLLLVQVVEPRRDLPSHAAGTPTVPTSPTGCFVPIREADEMARAEAEAYLERIAAAPRAAGHAVDVHVAGGDYPPATIAALARRAGAAAIALSTHGRSGLARLVMGSVATETIQLAEVPVLLVRPAAVRQARDRDATDHSAAAQAAQASHALEMSAERPMRLALTRGELVLLRRGLERLVEGAVPPLGADDAVCAERLRIRLGQAQADARCPTLGPDRAACPAPIVDGVRGPDDLDPIFIPERLRAQTGR